MTAKLTNIYDDLPREALEGHRFGRLEVVRFVGVQRSQRRWECVCDCGNTKITSTHYLIAGVTQSCGCLQRERAGPKPRHGMSGTPEYRAWCMMKQRCTNPNWPGWHNWGGRGIQVCDRWLDSFDAFYEDVGDRPGLEYSLGRIDNDGHYEPGNVEWQTPEQQAANMRRPRSRFPAIGSVSRELKRKRSGRKTGVKQFFWRGKWRDA